MLRKVSLVKNHENPQVLLGGLFKLFQTKFEKLRAERDDFSDSVRADLRACLARLNH